ncbi:hypothetical protein EDB84DRAFT_1461368 [Lactarius hengduanensis]|nr:hypothetical protein EDB84DRAFT_1461368 [Lactarius hengduanensis]
MTKKTMGRHPVRLVTPYLGSPPTDNMLVTALVEQNVPQLHFFVYDEPTEYLGPHHDLLLSSMPLCLEWLDYSVSSAGKHGHRGRPRFTFRKSRRHRHARTRDRDLLHRPARLRLSRCRPR